MAYTWNEATTRQQLAAAQRRLAHDLGGSTPMVVIRPVDGALRYRGLLTGLKPDRATSVCKTMRARDEDCLVLSPDMLAAALNQQRVYHMLSARQ